MSHEQDSNFRGHVWAGLGTVFLLILGVGGWTASAQISGAVIASGTLVVDSSLKKIQHPYGGVVETIRVKEGDKVASGDTLLTLDATVVQANLGVIASQISELTGRKARLEAEAEGAASPKFPDKYAEQDESRRTIAADEVRLLDMRRATARSQRSQLTERIGQYRKEEEGLRAQITAKAKEVKLVADELKRVDAMYRKELLPVTRVIPLQREAARIEGELGALQSQLARTGGQIAEIEIQIIGLEETFRSDALKELREVQSKLSELSEREIAARDQLKRIIVRAPDDGIIHELAFHTIDCVLGPGQTIMALVPNEDALAVEVNIAPVDIDHVPLGATTIMRFPGFKQTATPEISGRVVRVAADISRDPQSAPPYYLVKVEMDKTAYEKLKGFKLVAGMPVEAYVDTGNRSVASYLIKPFTDHFQRAMREE